MSAPVVLVLVSNQTRQEVMPARLCLIHAAGASPQTALATSASLYPTWSTLPLSAAAAPGVFGAVASLSRLRHLEVADCSRVSDVSLIPVKYLTALRSLTLRRLTEVNSVVAGSCVLLRLLHMPCFPI